MSDFVDDLYTKLKARRAAGYKYKGYLYPEKTRKYFYVPELSKDDLTELENVAVYFGVKPVWLANLINLESAGTFNPAVQNSIGATGLIQIIPSTATTMGTSVNLLRLMTFKQQMKYVKKYLYDTLIWKKIITKDNVKVPETFTFLDLCMTVFYPPAIGKPDFVMPASVVGSNPSVKTAQDYIDAVFEQKFMDDIYDIVTAPITIASNIISSEFVKKNLALLVGATMLLAAGIAGIILMSAKKTNN